MAGRASPLSHLPAAALALIAFLVVLSARQDRPGPRLSRKARLVDLIQQEDDRARSLRRQLDDLQAQLGRLSSGASGREQVLAEVRSRAEALAPLAGLTAVRGRGLRVVLTDSSLRESPTGDPNDLVIHEQDIQAVVNALWGAGAEAIAVNGERVTSRSAIRCVGNTLLLHGSVYSPPYRIAAVGDPAALEAGLGRDPLVERFGIAAEEFRLGFRVERASVLAIPAFRGINAVRFAERAV